MHLTVRHLEVFNALMEAGSVSNAAQRLNVTQPAVSVALANLERELGFALFRRARGFFAPTEEALLLHAEAERGLLALAQVRRRAAAIRAGAVGGLTIASNGAMALTLLPRLIADLRADRPGLQVDLTVRSSRQVAMLVSEGQADLGLIDAPVPVAGLAATIHRLPCVAVMGAGDALAAEPVIRPAHLDGRSLIGITGEHGIDRRLDAVLAEAGVRAERQVTGAYFAILRQLVAAGAGLALVDVINGAADLGDGVIWRPFEPAIHFELAVIVAEGHALGPAGRDFLARVTDSLSRSCRRGASLAAQTP